MPTFPLFCLECAHVYPPLSAMTSAPRRQWSLHTPLPATQLLSSSTAFTPSPCRPLLSPSRTALTVEHCHHNGAASSQHCPHSGAAPIVLLANGSVTHQHCPPAHSTQSCHQPAQWSCHQPAATTSTVELPAPAPQHLAHHPNTTGAAYTSHHLDIALPVTASGAARPSSIVVYHPDYPEGVPCLPRCSVVRLVSVSCGHFCFEAAASRSGFPLCDVALAGGLQCPYPKAFLSASVRQVRLSCLRRPGI